jgi:rare lipoprotein A
VNRSRFRLPASLVLLTFLAACASGPTRDSGPAPGTVSRSSLPGDPVPRAEPKSRYGNGPYYKVNGKTYKVLDTSYGYQERGVASWYGKKFHGRMTSSQEPYDMYGMTAAHKSLPLPTYVRVRNLKNNRSIIVRVNDRGPFVDNRIIDLSYSAAEKLDMIRDGTSLVEVTAISFDEAPPASTRAARQPARSPSPAISGDIFVQVGAFGEAGNARRRYLQLRDSGIGRAFVDEARSGSGTLYRVRIGPIADVNEYDSIVRQLQRLGINDTHLVTD